MTKICGPLTMQPCDGPLKNIWASWLLGVLQDHTTSFIEWESLYCKLDCMLHYITLILCYVVYYIVYYVVYYIYYIVWYVTLYTTLYDTIHAILHAILHCIIHYRTTAYRGISSRWMCVKHLNRCKTSTCWRVDGLVFLFFFLLLFSQQGVDAWSDTAFPWWYDGGTPSSRTCDFNIIFLQPAKPWTGVTWVLSLCHFISCTVFAICQGGNDLA